jgi:hypothetical protein
LVVPKVNRKDWLPQSSDNASDPETTWPVLDSDDAEVDGRVGRKIVVATHASIMVQLPAQL